MLGRNQLQTLASQVIQAVAGGCWRPSDVGAELFFQAWSGGEQRSDPMGLFGLGFRDSGKPVGEISGGEVLGGRGRNRPRQEGYKEYCVVGKTFQKITSAILLMHITNPH